LTISPVKNSLGKIIAASKIARDITDQKRSAAQLAILAREAEHRTKNILTTVQAAVSLTKADTIADFKAAIEGRIQALANVTRLFVESRWAGAELRGLVTQSLLPIDAMAVAAFGLRVKAICSNPVQPKRLR
jgi:two-component sensor histidine kinase